MYNKLVTISIFYTAFVSIFLIPSFHGLILVHFGLIITFFLVFPYMSLKKIRMTKYESHLFLFFLFFYLSSMLGAYHSGGINGVVTSQIFLLCFFLTYFAYQNDLLSVVLKGFYLSALFSSVFIIADALYYYCFGNFEPLIYKIFPSTLAAVENGGHTLENRSTLMGAIFYRPCGLSWDPGMSITAIVLAFVLYNENLIKIKKRKFCNFIFVISIFLSLSKSSIIALFIYILLKFFSLTSKKIAETKKRLVFYIAIFIFLFLFFIGFLINYTGSGNQRHLKYFSSLVYTLRSNPLYFLFGYGFTNPGLFFDLYVNWLNSTGFSLTGTSCESTLTNIFLIGGAIGSVFWIFSFYLLLKTNKASYLYVLLTIFIISFGYTIVSCWFYIAFFSITFSAINFLNKKEQLCLY